MAICSYNMEQLGKLQQDCLNAAEEYGNKITEMEASLEGMEADLSDLEQQATDLEAAVTEAQTALSEAQAAAASTPPTIEVTEEETYTETDPKTGKTTTKTRTVTKTIPNPAYKAAQEAVVAAQNAVNQAREAVKNAKKAVKAQKALIQKTKATITDMQKSQKDMMIYADTVGEIIAQAGKADLDASDLITVDWGNSTYSYNNKTYNMTNDISDIMYNGGLQGGSDFATMAETNAEIINDGFHHYNITVDGVSIDLVLEQFSPTGDVNNISHRLSYELMYKLSQIEAQLKETNKGLAYVSRLMLDLGFPPEKFEEYMRKNGTAVMDDGTVIELNHNYSEETIQQFLATYRERYENGEGAYLNDWVSQGEGISNWYLSENNCVFNISDLLLYDENGNPYGQFNLCPGSQQANGDTSSCALFAFYGLISNYFGEWKIPWTDPNNSYTSNNGDYWVDGKHFTWKGGRHKGQNRSPSDIQEQLNSQFDNLEEGDLGIVLHYSHGKREHWVVITEWTGDLTTSTYWDPYYGAEVGWNGLQVVKSDNLDPNYWQFESEVVSVEG